MVPGAAADARAVQGGLRPDDLLPVHEAAGALAPPVGQPRRADLLLLLDDVGSDLVREEIEVPVRAQHAIHLARKLRQALVGERGEPVRGQPGGGASRAMDLQRFVGWIGDHQVDRFGREAAQELERVRNENAPAFRRRRRAEWKLEQVGFAHARNLPELPDTAFSMA